jgi:DNA-binding NarL/FixJ family response regulator
MALRAQADFPAHLLVVDDDDRIRSLLKRYLSGLGYSVTEASDAASARKLMDALTFDLVILDVMMPGEDGVSLTRSVRGERDTPIILLTALGDPSHRIEGLTAGADDYLGKPFEPEELVAQVESSLRQANRLMRFGNKPPEDGTRLYVPSTVELTPTEMKVVLLVAQGMSNREIAEKLNVSQRTIESHVSNMLNKTNLHNRTELARWAMESNRT